MCVISDRGDTYVAIAIGRIGGSFPRGSGCMPRGFFSIEASQSKNRGSFYTIGFNSSLTILMRYYHYSESLKTYFHETVEACQSFRTETERAMACYLHDMAYAVMLAICHLSLCLLRCG